MKLFLREHVLLMVMQLVQFALMLSVFWMDGYQNIRPVLYSVFLGFFILGAYLCYHYISRRQYYDRLSSPLETLDDSFQKAEQTPMSESLNQLLKEQYRHYHQKLKTAEQQQQEYQMFMEQWVHQMKTPLSVIELIAHDLDEPESSDIYAETDRMKTGLNTVLYMARLRTLEQDFHIKPVQVTDIVHEVNRENKRYFIRNKVYPKLQEYEEDIMVETDEKWLFFIISQFIHNAVKYSAGKADYIYLSLYIRDEKAVLEVKDYGVGISKTDVRRVFDPFFTGENGRMFRESTGMGLYITNEVAQYLGHIIELDSEEGSGTAVRIIFSETQNLTSL
ncbi:signal transduction histidine kinase [Salibacterium salarium]|uniref:sensor histidine kinase n=1 Tax=Salibacterium salarium TaxID=284579 RepID=UPI002789E544|nr:sensor histidine kinase [Salibacterium salarium]MDQ0300238.1 signal transduction histidine kinase [Salibacterium salarium]